jgi:hypothetical protein
MGGKAKSRCHFCMLKVSKLRNSYLNVMKLENYGHTGEFLNNNHQTLQKLYFFCVFTLTFKIQKVKKWQTPFWNPH